MVGVPGPLLQSWGHRAPLSFLRAGSRCVMSLHFLIHEWGKYNSVWQFPRLSTSVWWCSAQEFSLLPKGRLVHAEGGAWGVLYSVTLHHQMMLSLHSDLKVQLVPEN